MNWMKWNFRSTMLLNIKLNYFMNQTDGNLICQSVRALSDIVRFIRFEILELEMYMATN